MPAKPLSCESTRVIRVSASPPVAIPGEAEAADLHAVHLDTPGAEDLQAVPVIAVLASAADQVQFADLNEAQPSNRMPEPFPPSIVARPWPKEETTMGFSFVPRASLPRASIPAKVCPPARSSLSPAAKAVRLARSSVFQAFTGEVPALASSPFAASRWYVVLPGDGFFFTAGPSAAKADATRIGPIRPI